MSVAAKFVDISIESSGTGYAILWAMLNGEDIERGSTWKQTWDEAIAEGKAQALRLFKITQGAPGGSTSDGA